MGNSAEDSASFPWGTVWVDKAHGICRVKFVDGLHQTLQVTVEDEPTVLNEGDAMHFDSGAAHSYARQGTADCTAIVVVMP